MSDLVGNPYDRFSRDTAQIREALFLVLCMKGSSLAVHTYQRTVGEFCCACMHPVCKSENFMKYGNVYKLVSTLGAPDSKVDAYTTVTFQNFRTPKNFAVIYLKFKQETKT